MREFDVPTAQTSTSIAYALADMFESQRPGVLLTADDGSLRLIHFGTLGHVAANRAVTIAIEAVPAEHVLDATTFDMATAVAQAKKSRVRFALLGRSTMGARLVSVREDFAEAFISGSSGSRCTRPNKPPATASRDWYHYYPPTLLGSDPTKCRIDGSPIL